MIEDEDEKQITVSINDEVGFPLLFFFFFFFFLWEFVHLKTHKNILVSITGRIRTCVYAQRRESFAQFPITIKTLSWESHYGS